MTTTHTAELNVPIRVLSGSTVVIDYAGLHLLTDPTFDEPGEYLTPIPGLSLVKTEPSPASPKNLGKVDAVLLSHDEHDDNLDRSGREFLANVPVTSTTLSGARRLGGTTQSLEFWEKATIQAPDGTPVTVTGMPALDGPEGSEAVAGDVIGFLLTAPGHPSVYVSGDNASLALVGQIADRVGPIDIAVLFSGGVRHEPVLDGALVTMDNALAAQAAKLLGAHRVVPAHFEGWAHFREGRAELIEAFTKAGIADRLTLM